MKYMEQIISKEEFDEIMKIKGEVRGISIKNIADFVRREKGEEGLNKLEDTMAKLGYPIKYKKIKTLKFYPLKWITISLIVIKKLFNFDDKKFQEIGRFTAKTPFTVRRFFMKPLFSTKIVKRETEKIWQKFFTVGSLRIKEFSEEKKYLILRVEDFHCHPLFCQAQIGLFSTISKMLLGTDVTCEETKCMHRGDDYHEFLVKW